MRVVKHLPIAVEVNHVPHILKNDTLLLRKEEDNVVIFFQEMQDTIFCFWDGIDKDTFSWQQRTIQYTNIKGGNYEFHFGKDKYNLEHILYVNAHYSIAEHPFFIPSVIFSLLAIFGAIIYLWLMYNFRQKLKVQGLRNQIASDLHDEVGSSLSSIAVFSKVLRKNLIKNAPDALPILDKIVTTARDTIMNLRDTVWAINPDNDSFERLIEKMRSFAHEMLINEDILLTYHNELEKEHERYKTLNISMEQRRNVYLMFKECINNIVKHAEAKSVSILITNHIEGFEIAISDDGKGFDLTQHQEGNGIKNLEHRAKECFITLNIQSAKTKGTQINMIVPEL